MIRRGSNLIKQHRDPSFAPIIPGGMRKKEDIKGAAV